MWIRENLQIWRPSVNNVAAQVINLSDEASNCLVLSEGVRLISKTPPPMKVSSRLISSTAFSAESKGKLQLNTFQVNLAFLHFQLVNMMVSFKVKQSLSDYLVSH